MANNENEISTLLFSLDRLKITSVPRRLILRTLIDEEIRTSKLNDIDNLHRDRLIEDNGRDSAIYMKWGKNMLQIIKKKEKIDKNKILVFEEYKKILKDFKTLYVKLNKKNKDSIFFEMDNTTTIREVVNFGYVQNQFSSAERFPNREINEMVCTVQTILHDFFNLKHDSLEKKYINSSPSLSILRSMANGMIDATHFERKSSTSITLQEFLKIFEDFPSKVYKNYDVDQDFWKDLYKSFLNFFDLCKEIITLKGEIFNLYSKIDPYKDNDKKILISSNIAEPTPNFKFPQKDGRWRLNDGELKDKNVETFIQTIYVLINLKILDNKFYPHMNPKFHLITDTGRKIDLLKEVLSLNGCKYMDYVNPHSTKSYPLKYFGILPNRNYELVLDFEDSEIRILKLKFPHNDNEDDDDDSEN